MEKIAIRLPDYEQDGLGGRVLNRYYYLALIILFFGLSASCWLGYQLIGATVDENGLLVEVFALIPLAWFFLLLGLITGFYLIWKNRRP